MSAVPEPAMLWLLAGGLLGLFGCACGRRKKSRQGGPLRRVTVMRYFLGAWLVLAALSAAPRGRHYRHRQHQPGDRSEHLDQLDHRLHRKYVRGHVDGQ